MPPSRSAIFCGSGQSPRCLPRSLRWPLVAIEYRCADFILESRGAVDEIKAGKVERMSKCVSGEPDVDISERAVRMIGIKCPQRRFRERGDGANFAASPADSERAGSSSGESSI